jgi:hypothetical protein
LPSETRIGICKLLSHAHAAGGASLRYLEH